jgi:hypothetical protein
MLFVLILDGAGYFIAVSSISGGQTALTAALEDIFVVVALLTICVGLVLPGMITHSAAEVSDAAKRLTSGTLKEFSCAMAALGVEPQEVVPGQSEPADRRLRFYTTVGPVPIVLVQPDR